MNNSREGEDPARMKFLQIAWQNFTATSDFDDIPIYCRIEWSLGDQVMVCERTRVGLL